MILMHAGLESLCSTLSQHLKNICDGEEVVVRAEAPSVIKVRYQDRLNSGGNQSSSEGIHSRMMSEAQPSYIQRLCLVELTIPSL